MELRSIPILTLLCVALVGSHAATTPELYWKEVLPNVAMPKPVINSLPDQVFMDNKGTSVNVQKGGVHVKTGGSNHGNGGTSVNVGPHNGVTVNHRKPSNGGTNVNVGPKGGVGVSTGKPGGRTNVNVGPKGGVRVTTGKPNKGGSSVGVGKGGITVHAGPKKKPVYVGVHPGSNPFNYNYAASVTQAHDDPTRALFFLEKDLKTSHQMTIHFPQSTNAATFLPREEAQSLAFSTDKMSEILHEFSVQQGSGEAQTIEQTIKGCESKGISGEEKYCATSLESMVDYAKNTLGKNVRAISTDAKDGYNKGRKYIIDAVRKVATKDGVAVCHKQNYPYAVFYCHKTKGTSPYIVSLISEDGSKTKAVAVCHKDTSGWNPKHLAFQVLSVKPGSVPICHFLPEDHIVWVRN